MWEYLDIIPLRVPHSLYLSHLKDLIVAKVQDTFVLFKFHWSRAKAGLMLNVK